MLKFRFFIFGLQALYDPWQAQPLPDQGEEDDHDGDENNFIAQRKGAAVGEFHRESDRNGQGNNAPHARPADDQAILKIEQSQFCNLPVAFVVGTLQVGFLPEYPGHAQREGHYRDDQCITYERPDLWPHRGIVSRSE